MQIKATAAIEALGPQCAGFFSFYFGRSSFFYFCCCTIWRSEFSFRIVFCIRGCDGCTQRIGTRTLLWIFGAVIATFAPFHSDRHLFTFIKMQAKSERRTAATATLLTVNLCACDSFFQCKVDIYMAK